MATDSGIVSSDVVGYQEVATPAGYSMRAATFKAISGNYKISDIKVAGDGIGYGDEYGQVVNEDGTWGDTYYYLVEDSGAEADGWYKNDPTGSEPVTDEDVINIGQAFFFSSSADITLTYAGQVISGSPVVAVPAGYSMVGNPTPVTAKISSLTVDGDGIGYGDEYGQVVNPDGSWGDTYYYLVEDSGAEANGWYKNDPTGSEPVTDEDVIGAGDSLFFSASAELTITFPSVL